MKQLRTMVGKLTVHDKLGKILKRLRTGEKMENDANFH